MGDSRAFGSPAEENNNAPSYKGVSLERVRPDINTNYDGNSSCVTYYRSAVYTTSWVSDFEEGWVEFGTGFQCKKLFRYRFWGHGYFNSPGWVPLGQTRLYGGLGTAQHRYTMSHFSASWNWYYDSAFVTGIPTSSIGLNKGDRLRVGLESYREDATVPYHVYDRLKEKLSGGWSDWEGFDDFKVELPLHGNWPGGDPTEWAAWQ